ncbi:MAG: gliding motility-associated C-terminal domain-containing protein, partial [Flavobacteriales bacterium]
PGDLATLIASSASGGTPPYSAVWSTGSFNDTITVNPMATTTYTYTVTDNCGLDSTVTATVTVPVPAPLQVQTLDGDICKEANGTILLPVTASGGNGGYLYSWISTTGSTISVDGATGGGIVYNPENGNYIVVVTDQCGNMGADTATVIVKPCELTIPNVFSPNGDGSNDVFFIKNLESHPGSILTIFNRWGQVLYESKDYKNDWKAPGIADGVYYYTVTLTDGYEPADYHGFFHLLRTKK